MDDKAVKPARNETKEAFMFILFLGVAGAAILFLWVMISTYWREIIGLPIVILIYIWPAIKWLLIIVSAIFVIKIILEYLAERIAYYMKK